MKKEAIILILVILFTLTAGCSGVGVGFGIRKSEPKPTEEPKKEESATDLMMQRQMAEKKFNGYLQKTLTGLLESGEIISRTVEGESINGEYEIVVEKWIIDNGGNQHLITIKNGVLNKISPIRNAAKGPEPIGGWKN